MTVISENKVDIDFILDWISDWTLGLCYSHKSSGLISGSEKYSITSLVSTSLVHLSSILQEIWLQILEMFAIFLTEFHVQFIWLSWKSFGPGFYLNIWGLMNLAVQKETHSILARMKRGPPPKYAGTALSMILWSWMKRRLDSGSCWESWEHWPGRGEGTWNVILGWKKIS